MCSGRGTWTGHKDARDKIAALSAKDRLGHQPALFIPLGFLQRLSLQVMVNYRLVSREFVQSSMERQ